MPGKEYFNQNIEIEGKIIVKSVPNSTGELLTYNSTGKEISTRTNTEIISDMSLMTTDTAQNVTAIKSYNTSGGNAFNNHALRVQSKDGSNPGMTFYKGGVDIATIQFDGTNFKFRDYTDTLSKYVSALGYKKDGSNNSFFLLGGGGHISASNYPTVVQADEKYVPYTGAITNVNLNGKNISNVGSVDATVFRNGGSSVLVKSFVLHSTTVVSSLGIKLTTPTSSSMMGSFTVTIFGYIGQTISFRVSMYKFQNNWHVPSITWVHGDSSKISNIEFYKEDDSNLHMKVNFVTNFGSYNRTVITDVLAIGGDPLHNPDTYTISLNPDNSAHTLQQTILNSQIVRDTLGDAPKTPIKLSTSDLNTITTPGFYNQIDDANATPARNYPVNLAGTLNVYRSIVNGVIQEYTSHVGITYKRYYNGSAWASWTQLIDSVNGSNSFITSNTNQTGLTGDKTTSGNWTFNQSPIVPVATLPTQAVNFSQISNLANSNHTHTFDSLTSKPTTIAGYGITDAFQKQNVIGTTIDLNTLTLEGVYYGYQWVNSPSTIAIASVTVKRYSNDWIRQEFNLINGSSVTYVRDRSSGSSGTTWSAWKVLADRDWVANNYSPTTHTHTFSSLTDKPTTIVGYGITDAIPLSQKGVANGVATLDSDGLIPSIHLPSYVDDVIEAANLAALNALPASEKQTGKIYVTTDDNKSYRWGGTVFVEISSGAVQSVNGQTGVVNLTYTDVGAVPLNHTHTIAQVTGLQSALDDKVDDSQVLTNVPINAIFTDTKYTAGNGLTLTGTVFSLPVAVTGSGNYITDVTQSPNGITVTKGTLPTYTLSVATSTVLGGVKLFSDTVQSVASNVVSATVGKTYGIQANASGQLVVNVPWVDTNNTYTSSNGILLTGSNFAPTYGTTANTVAQGNDSRILNGQTAFGWGNHALAGYATTSQLASSAFPRQPTTTNVIDLNTLTLEGVYYSYQWLNQPTQATASLTVKRYSTDWIRQEYNVMDGSGLTYVRDRTRGTTWGNWKIVANRDWVNSQLASYVTQSSLTSQLGNYATLNGIQTFTNTITFDKSPIIPDATLVPHAVNLGQMTDYVDVNTGSILNQVAANYMSNTHVANSITSANISNWNSAFNFTNSFNTNFPDLIAIENLSGVDGYLRKDGNGQWSLTQSPIGDATSTNAGKVKLFSDTVQSVASNVISTTASRTYGVQVNTTGQMVVNVPWVDTNTAYTAGNGLTLTGTVFSLPVTVSGSGNYISDVVQNVNGITVTKGTLPTYSLPLATTSILGGIKLITDTQNNIAPNAVTTVIERSYAVQLNSLNQALVNVPWTDTVYVHPTTSGNKHIPEGGSANQILRWSSDGTAVWGAENNTTYSAGNGLTLTGTVFSLPVTVSGSGNYIIDVVQNVNGITVTKGTLPIYVTQASLTTQLATKINALDSATGLGFVGGTPDTPYVKHANGTEVTVATSIWCSNNFLTIHSNQNVTGVKSFLFSPIIPNASLPVHPVNLGQLSGILTSGYARLASNQTFTGTNIFTLSPTVPSASQPNDALPLGQADEIVQTRINGKFAEVIYKNSANDLIFDFSSYRGVKIVTITCKGNNFQNIRVEHMPKSVTLKIMNSSQYLNPTIYFNGGTIVTSIGNTTWAEFYRDQDGDIFKNNVNGTNIIQ